MNVYGSGLIILFTIKNYIIVISIIFMDYLSLFFIIFLLKVENIDIHSSESREQSMDMTSLSQRYRVMSLNLILHEITR